MIDRASWHRVVRRDAAVGLATTLLLVGCAGSDPSRGVGLETPVFPASAVASLTPSGVLLRDGAATLDAADIDRTLTPGSYRVQDPFSAPFSIGFPTEWTLKSLAKGDISFQNTAVNGAEGAPWITIDRVETVFDDPCHGGPIMPPVRSTVDGIIAALTTMVGFTAGPVADVVLDGHAGKSVELRNVIDTQTAACEDGPMLPMWTIAGGGAAATNSHARENIWVVDVDGAPLLIDGTMFTTTPEASRAEIEQIVQTLRFGSSPPAPVPSAAVASKPSPTLSAPHLTYVALGDSLLYALEQDCDGCTSATVIYGRQMAADLGLPVEVHNLTMHNGLTSPGLLAYLEDGARIGRDPEDVLKAVAAADIVSVTTGFNDVASPDVATLPALMDAYEANLEGILARISTLRAGKPTMLRVTQIYNNGGAAWKPIVEAQNDVICDVAVRHDAVCVDIYHPFNGPDGQSSPSESGYLGADGTHPSQLGMEVIADALVASGYAPLD